MSNYELRSRSAPTSGVGLEEWHCAFDLPGSCKWRLTADGVEIEKDGVPRSKGNPTTVDRIWTKFHYPLCAASLYYGVPVELVIATIATESGGRANALRREPGYTGDESTPHRVSPGIMQTLISTARAALVGEVPREDINRNWLFDAQNSIRAGVRYIASQRPKTRFDPPLVASAYNAGGVYLQKGRNNRWKTRQYPIGTSEHVDRYVMWYNDAVAAVLASKLSAPHCNGHLLEDPDSVRPLGDV